MIKKLFCILCLTLFFATESHAADKWVWLSDMADGANLYYNVTRTHREKGGIILTETGIKKSGGEATTKIKINCKTRKMDYGPTDMYSSDGDFLYSLSSDWSGWQAGKGSDWNYLSKICIAQNIRRKNIPNKEKITDELTQSFQTDGWNDLTFYSSGGRVFIRDKKIIQEKKLDKGQLVTAVGSILKPGVVSKLKKAGFKKGIFIDGKNRKYPFEISNKYYDELKTALKKAFSAQ